MRGKVIEVEGMLVAGRRTRVFPRVPSCPVYSVTVMGGSLVTAAQPDRCWVVRGGGTETCRVDVGVTKRK